jgi:hypothetical protein
MRELVGVPQSVLAATRSADGWFWSVLFQHKGFNTYYEVRRSSACADNRWESTRSQSLMPTSRSTAVASESRFNMTRWFFNVNADISPYVKGLPTTLTIESMNQNGDFSTEVIRPSFVDNYTLEYQELYDAVVNGKEYKTTPLDAKEDLKINDMIWAALVK